MLKVKHVLSCGSRFGTQMAVIENSLPLAICSSSFYDANLILRIVLYEWYHIKLSLIHLGSDEDWRKLWNLVLDTQNLAPWIRRPPPQDLHPWTLQWVKRSRTQHPRPPPALVPFLYCRCWKAKTQFSVSLMERGLKIDLGLSYQMHYTAFGKQKCVEVELGRSTVGHGRCLWGFGVSC